jgi:hypothetical protein
MFTLFLLHIYSLFFHLVYIYVYFSLFREEGSILLLNCMDQSPFWEADNHLDGQEPAIGPILSLLDTFSTLTFFFLICVV